MSRFLDSTNQTAVKILCVSLMLMSGNNSLAQSTDAATPAAPAAAAPSPTPVVVSTQSPEQIKSAMCNQALSHLKDARNKISEACRKSGLGSGTNCVSKAQTCSDVSGSASFGTMDALGMALGLPAGANIGNSCPQLSGRDYFSEKDKIQKEIKDTERELADLNTERADIQDDYNKEMVNLEESLSKAKEDYRKLEEQLEDEERARLAEFTDAQNQAKESMRKLGTDILEIEGQLITLQRQKAIELNKLTDAAGKRQCVAQINAYKAEYEKMYSKNSSTSSNQIAQSKKKREELTNMYNTCMNDFHQKRVQANETYKTAQERLEKSMRDKQASLTEAEDSMNLAANQLEEMKQATAKKKSNALQAVVELGERNQKLMEAAYTKLQENIKALDEKKTSLTQALNRANQALMTLGPAPTSRSGDYSATEAASEIAAQQEIIEDLKTQYGSDCPVFQDRDSRSSSRTSRGSRSSSGTR